MLAGIAMYDHYDFYPYYSSLEVDYLSDYIYYFTPSIPIDYLDEAARQKDSTLFYRTQK